MTYHTKKTYALDVPVLYNNLNTNNINNVYVPPANISMVGGYKKIIAGSWLTVGTRLLNRAIVVGAYTARATKVIVNNPWAFLPGDTLNIIGDANESAIAERNAVQQATAPVFGTVDSVDPGVEKFSATITVASAAVDEVFSLSIEEVEISYIASTTDTADVITGLYNALIMDRQASHHSSLDGVEVVNNSTDLTITAKELGTIFKIVGSANVTVTVAENTGVLNITPGAGNANLAVGAKIGSIDKPGLGIYANTLYLTDDDDQERLADYAPYDAGNINKKSLTYLDGDLVSANQTLKYVPAYGL